MKRLYIDMDNVLVDFRSGIDSTPTEIVQQYSDNLDNIPGFFSKMKPLPGAIEAFEKLAEKYDVYILSTAPWGNPSAWQDKVLWVQKYLGEVAYKRLILSHHKNLCKGDYIIDDRTLHGVDLFEGEHIHFGTARFPDWNSVLDYLL
jgi:5'(3')-deoxyribonucleotidase